MSSEQCIAFFLLVLMMSGLGLCTAPFHRRCDAIRGSELSFWSPSIVLLMEYGLSVPLMS